MSLLLLLGAPPGEGEETEVEAVVVPGEALYPAENLYPSEGLYPSDGRVQRLRSKPPLELDVEIETAEGAIFRLPADALAGTDRPYGLSFSTVRGDGFGTASLTLNRQIFKDYPDIGLLDTWRFIGRQEDIVYEGRLHSDPRTNDPGQQITINLVGWMTYLKERPIAPLIVDRRLGGWGEPSIQRKSILYTDGYREEATVSSGWQETEGNGPGIVFVFQRFDGVYWERGEVWFYAGGEDIGELRFDFNQLTSEAESTAWHTAGLLSSNDVVAAFDEGTNLHNVDASGQVVEASESGRKYAFLRSYYQGTFEGDTNIVYAFLNPRVIGTHGLQAQGASPNEGYAISDVIQFILSFYPKIEWAGQTNSFLLQQATWHDSPSTGYDIIQTLNNLVLWGTSVWEGRRFHFEQEDLTTYDWQVRTDEEGVRVEFSGDTIENFANGIVVHYEDFFGHSYTLYPDEHEELRDENENNPATRHDEDLWTEKTIPWKCLEAEALQLGRTYLADYNRPKRPATVTVSGGYIKDSADHWHQGWKPRAGETVGIMDHPQDEPRLIFETDWDQEGATLTLHLDAPPATSDAIAARQELALQAGNLSG